MISAKMAALILSLLLVCGTSARPLSGAFILEPWPPLCRHVLSTSRRRVIVSPTVAETSAKICHAHACMSFYPVT